MYCKFAAQNIMGTGPQSAASNVVTPAELPASDILYAEKIPALLAAFKSASSQRVNIAAHGMSIWVGAGAIGGTSTTWSEAWATDGLIGRCSAAINAARGGVMGRGVETVSSMGGTNPFFTLGGGATILPKQGSAGGTCGQGVSLSGGQAYTLSFPVTNGVAGQQVKIFAFITGGAGGVLPRYSLSGANTQATTALPASTTAAPTPVTGYFWYETTLTMTNAGTTTVTLLAPSAAGASFVVYAVDRDVKTVPGLTLHRLSQSGETIATNVGASIDNTDTQPTSGNWMGGGANAALFRAAQTDSLTVRQGVTGVIAGADINDILAYSANVGAYGYGWTLADHQRHLTNYANAMLARGLQVLFVLGNLRAPDTPAIAGTPYTQTDVINVYKAVAAASTNCAVLDMTTMFRGAGGTNTEAQTFAAQTADTSRWLASEGPRFVHPAPDGHLFYGNYLGSQIIAAAG